MNELTARLKAWLRDVWAYVETWLQRDPRQRNYRAGVGDDAPEGGQVESDGAVHDFWLTPEAEIKALERMKGDPDPGRGMARDEADA